MFSGNFAGNVETVSMFLGTQNGNMTLELSVYTLFSSLRQGSIVTPDPAHNELKVRE